MSTSATTRGSSISQHMRAIEKLLQDATLDAKYACRSETRHIGGLKCNFAGSRRSLTRLRLSWWLPLLSLCEVWATPSEGGKFGKGRSWDLRPQVSMHRHGKLSPAGFRSARERIRQRGAEIPSSICIAALIRHFPLNRRGRCGRYKWV